MPVAFDCKSTRFVRVLCCQASPAREATGVKEGDFAFDEIGREDHPLHVGKPETGIESMSPSKEAINERRKSGFVDGNECVQEGGRSLGERSDG